MNYQLVSWGQTRKWWEQIKVARGKFRKKLQKFVSVWMSPPLPEATGRIEFSIIFIFLTKIAQRIHELLENELICLFAMTNFDKFLENFSSLGGHCPPSLSILNS